MVKLSNKLHISSCNLIFCDAKFQGSTLVIFWRSASERDVEGFAWYNKINNSVGTPISNTLLPRSLLSTRTHWTGWPTGSSLFVRYFSGSSITTVKRVVCVACGFNICCGEVKSASEIPIKLAYKFCVGDGIINFSRTTKSVNHLLIIIALQVRYIHQHHHHQGKVLVVGF